MNITLTIDPELEQRLLTRASQRGLSLDALLVDLVKTEAGSAVVAQTAVEKAESFLAWAGSHRPTKPLSDEAISRAELYPDRV